VRQLKSQMDALAPQVDSRLREQAGDSEKRAAALTARLEGLATTLTRLNARVDDLSARMERLVRPGGAPPPARTTPTPGAPGPPSVPGPTTPSGLAPTPSPPGARPSTGSLQPQDVYQAAYIDFSKGNYALAIAGFREFLRRYPDNDLSDNAQYWIGEAYVAQARAYADAGKNDQAVLALQQAVQEFRKVIANYPRGDKAPTALYKEALALIELKQPDVAQQRLQYLIDNFPQAEETPLARERLTALKER
jgi:tol-pal system protein YbgF